MRKLAVSVLVGVATLVLADPGAAAPLYDLVWTGTTGSGTIGGSAIEAESGDQLTLDVIIIVDGQGFSAAAFNLFGTGVTAVSGTELSGFIGGVFFSPLAIGVNVVGSDILNYDTLSFIPLNVPGSYVVGQGVFDVTSDSGGSVSTEFASILGGVIDGTFTFSVPPISTATFSRNAGTPIPEPSAAALFALGTLVVGGRMRRVARS
ncbi:MAG: hypothetical protein JRH16_13645 [Deltaproteobacteria bacterium]|nr:hypothetical protein [Deltaproteobacteria bacterium]MBW2363071.1 hypothetical protein [Deltaproteobacteria bacterium]